MQIDFLGVQALLAIAESGSFAMAAARLHLSQTAISHRMRKLEESLGTTLVVRTSRGITLTDAGQALLPRARAAVRQLEVSFDELRRHGQALTHRLAFGCLPTLAVGLMAPLLEAMHAHRPHASVRVFDSSPSEIAELVQAGTAAFGLTLAQRVPPGLQAVELAREPFVLLCPAGHALAQGGPVAWSVLRRQPLIRISLPSGNSMTIDDALGALRDELPWRFETQRTALAIDLVRSGLGLTVVPRLSVPPDGGLVALPLVQPSIERELVLVSRPGVALREDERFLAARAGDLLRARLAAA